jgi:ornithine cyclodeaminase/alanine dehydrogenase-like protein (mu-crystallin family)
MPHDIRIVTEAELRQAVALDLSLVDVIERAFAALSEGGVVMPPVLSMDLPQANGEVDVKTAWIPGVDSFAIKVSPGFFDNPKIGLPSLNGLMILFRRKRGSWRPSSSTTAISPTCAPPPPGRWPRAISRPRGSRPRA